MRETVSASVPSPFHPNSTSQANLQLEIRRNLPQNHPKFSLRRAQILPSTSMLRINEPSILLHPSQAPRLGVAVIRDIVDMALESPERRLSFIVNVVLCAQATKLHVVLG